MMLLATEMKRITAPKTAGTNDKFFNDSLLASDADRAPVSVNFLDHHCLSFHLPGKIRLLYHCFILIWEEISVQSNALVVHLVID